MPYQNPPKICPVCKEKADFKFIQDYKNKWGEWSLYECSKCQVQFWLPFKNPGEKWYETEGNAYYEIANLKKQLQKPKPFFLKVIKELEKINGSLKNNLVLDLGCGPGYFISLLKNKNCEVWGVDFDKNAINFIKEYLNLNNIYNLSFEKFFKLSNLPKFDIISFFDVIEHLDDPLGFITNVKKILDENGIIVFSCPSRERLFPNLLKYDFPPVHLTRYNQVALTNLFKKTELNIVKILYIGKFSSLLDVIDDTFRTNIIQQTIKFGKEKNISARYTILLTKVFQILGLAKRFLLLGIPTYFLYLFSELLGYKNGWILAFIKNSVKKAKSNFKKNLNQFF